MPVSLNNTQIVFNDATTQTTSGVTSIGTGTGISSTGGKTPTLTNTGVTSVAAGSGISVSGSTGAVTISASGGGVTSLNGQTGAITNTGLDAIGSYTSSWYAISIPPNTTQTVTAGTTVAGSTLRYNASVFGPYNGTGQQGANGSGNATRTWPSGGTAYTGTWRCMQRGELNVNIFDSENNKSFGTWSPTIWVRIS